MLKFLKNIFSETEETDPPSDGSSSTSSDTTNNDQADTSETVENTEENSDEETEETTEESTAKKLVCHGAKCGCDKSESPTEVELQVLSHSKFYINDNAGSQKLIASNMELPLPFNKPFFGKCTLKPSSSGNLPCQPVLQGWDDPYEGVELGNGGKILTEDSTAMCIMGGLIDIKDHGQDPAEITEQQIADANTTAAAIQNPMITETEIEIISGGITDDDEEDQTGRGVKKINTVTGRKAFLKDEWIHCKVTKWYNGDAPKDKVNWIIYDQTATPIQEHVDLGEDFSARISKNGKYIIEAYGSSAGGNNPARIEIEIKDQSLQSVKKSTANRIRSGESATFSITPNLGSFETLETGVTWQVFKEQVVQENFVTATSYQQTLVFEEKGKYTISATWGTQTKSTSLTIGGNYVTAIQADKTSMKLHNDKVSFSIPNSGFIITPALETEKEAVKWIVYDHEYNEVAQYQGHTGATFVLDTPPKTGIYYVEAYMNIREIGKVKSGRASRTIKKIKVTEPTVVKAEWRYKNEKRKPRTGFANETSYIYAELQSYHGGTVDIEVHTKKAHITTITNCKANNHSKIMQEFRMTDRYKTAIKSGDQELFFKIKGKDEPIKNENEAFYPQKGLMIIDKPMVRDAYFIYNGKRLRAKPVAYGVTVQGVVETVNMIGESLEVDIYRTQKLLYIDAATGDPKVFSKDLTVDAEGRITFDFTVESRWWRDLHMLGKYFYIGVEKADWAAFRKEQIYKGSILAYKKGDRLENGVSPVVVQRANVDLTNSCEGKHCIKLGAENKLIEEINIRLCGFGGNVPSKRFTIRTKDMIKQFQKDYMKITPTGKICGDTLKSIDKFEKKYTIEFDQIKCNCGTCDGFGKGLYPEQKQDSSIKEAYRKYEYPGIHRSLIWSLRAAMFYMHDHEEGKALGYSLNKISSGYRCHENNKQNNRNTTNHMGKALDLHFNKNGIRTRNVSDMEKIRKEIFNKYLGAKWDWKAGQNNIFNLESTKIGATSWIHYDVREFDQVYLKDIFFVKKITDTNKIIAIAKEENFSNTCDCFPKNKDIDKQDAINNRVDPETLKTSEQGIKFIKDWETFKAHAYNDAEGYCTIGYGHLITYDKCENIILSGEFKDGISEEKASELFNERLTEFENAIHRDINVNLYQYEFDALVSLLFNAGANFLNVGGINNGETKIKTYINDENYSKGADEFSDVTNNGLSGLVSRRKAEINMFKNNIYDSTH
ncbi:PAAR-like protein [Aquimarina sp. I32.4]|uniref:glycoside hydrolase family protein n=1 Tax=Aquimarina sp. I32.4 TaxID=2053903 RepID=UPI000CDF2759|nr:PAAR-like protein [Aquimarina sp. I32.4]